MTTLSAQVVFATITGNNEAVADIIVEKLKAAGVDVTKKEMAQSEPEELQDVDIAFLVPYTYDEGSLPDEVLDYFDDLKDLDLSNLVYGIAGSGDNFYEGYYCLALDKFEEQMQTTGARRVADLVRVNLYPAKRDEVKLAGLVDAAVEAAK
ncbi:flavodoxin domain-containing protein [Fructobacillus sp. W13]|uniref:Flavodoxin domain-containing protein n=1 Tax=Fructobacillus apis TaxID=2935017 RepID=A0ABT0ZQF5_9LACO|nr:flavodoxin domain-containing protein [Fructobacillus apis]MCO0832185.1 flavodoxin domain-containing protein [Fructobacillus apis]